MRKHAPWKPQSFSREDFSADAIEHRFSCGSWDYRDTQYIVAKLRDLETIKQRWADVKIVLEKPEDCGPIQGAAFDKAVNAMDEILK